MASLSTTLERTYLHRNNCTVLVKVAVDVLIEVGDQNIVVHSKLQGFEVIDIAIKVLAVPLVDGVLRLARDGLQTAEVALDVLQGCHLFLAINILFNIVTNTIQMNEDIFLHAVLCGLKDTLIGGVQLVELCSQLSERLHQLLLVQLVR